MRGRVAPGVVPMTSKTEVDLQVFTSVWDRTHEAANSEDAEIGDSVSSITERAMREAISRHRWAGVEEEALGLLEDLAAKKTGFDVGLDEDDGWSPAEYSGKSRARPYVDEEVAREWRSLAEHSQYLLGEVLSKHLDYYLQGGRPETVAGQLERARAEIAREDSDKSKAERIADRLGDSSTRAFTRAEFLEAAEAEGITTTKYALQEYLPGVLDLTDVHPAPANPDRFVPQDHSAIGEVPDPRNLPYHAMSEADQRLAIKTEALRMAKRGDFNKARFSASEGVDVLGGRPNHETVRARMREIAHESPDNGYRYDSDAGELCVLANDAQAANGDNEQALRILGLDADTDPAPAETDDDGDDGETDADTVTDWVDRAADLLADLPPDVPDPVIDNKIARARDPECVDEGGQVPVEVAESVTDADRQCVKEYLGWADTTNSDEIRQEATDELDCITATPETKAVRTDGGQPLPGGGD